MNKYNPTTSARHTVIFIRKSENQDLILNCPYNKISTALNPLVEYVGVKDVRTVAKAFCGYVSKKEFLNELKNCVKMYAGLV